MHKVNYIGIWGPKACSTGGHNSQDDLRVAIYQRMLAILSEYLDEPTVGLTALSAGVEQDFARACTSVGIDYNVYLPFSDQENRWSKIPAVSEEYRILLEGALNVRQLAEGSFSPKKILAKDRKIIADSNILIVVRGSLKTPPLEKLEGKIVHEIRIDQI